MAGAGSVAAFVVVAVLIVGFSKLGAFFKAGSGILGNSQTESSQAEAGELVLKDTEVNMPSVLGLSENMAESTLKEHSLTMKRTYEYFDDVEKVISNPFKVNAKTISQSVIVVIGRTAEL